MTSMGTIKTRSSGRTSFSLILSLHECKNSIVGLAYFIYMRILLNYGQISTSNNLRHHFQSTLSMHCGSAMMQMIQKNMENCLLKLQQRFELNERPNRLLLEFLFIYSNCVQYFFCPGPTVIGLYCCDNPANVNFW